MILLGEMLQQYFNEKMYIYHSPSDIKIFHYTNVMHKCKPIQVERVEYNIDLSFARNLFLFNFLKEILN